MDCFGCTSLWVALPFAFWLAGDWMDGVAAWLDLNTRFGNGDPIGNDIVQLLNEVYEANTAREPWQAGDLMLVDNIRSAHSREAFSGPREVLVAMAAPVRVTDTPQTPR